MEERGIGALPGELLGLVGQFVDVRDLGAMSRVNKVWHTVADGDDVWRIVCRNMTWLGDILKGVDVKEAVREMLDICKSFRQRPDQSIARVFQTKRYPKTARGIASFLYAKKIVLGEAYVKVYLKKRFNKKLPASKENPTLTAVMVEYCKLLDYSGLDLFSAVSKLLHSIAMPGEAQQIDLVFDAFSDCFCACHPDFSLSDTVPKPSIERRTHFKTFVYSCAYSMIMAYTDLTNVHIHNHMQPNAFLDTITASVGLNDAERSYFLEVFNKLPSSDLIQTHTVIRKGAVLIRTIESQNENISDYQARELELAVDFDGDVILRVVDVSSSNQPVIVKDWDVVFVDGEVEVSATIRWKCEKDEETKKWMKVLLDWIPSKNTITWDSSLY